METTSSASTKKRLTPTRIASIAFIVFAVFLALIGWALSMMRTGVGPSNDLVLNAIGLSNYVHVALDFSLLSALIGVVMAVFDLADKV